MMRGREKRLPLFAFATANPGGRNALFPLEVCGRVLRRRRLGVNRTCCASVIFGIIQQCPPGGWPPPYDSFLRNFYMALRTRIASIGCSLLFITTSRLFAAEGYFDSNGVKIRYTVQGKGEPGVLIH